MICSFCHTTSNTEYDCIQTLLENIKKHYLYFKQEHYKQDKEIHLLKSRNKQLNEVISMLQREKSSQSASQDWISAKRRRPPSINKNKSLIGSSSSDTSFNDELPQTSKLNVALDSEQLLDCSELNTTADDENIAESENIMKRTVSVITANRGNNSTNLLKEPITYNPIKKMVSINQSNTVNKADWLVKGSSCQKITHFITPLASETAQIMKKGNDKKVNLSLNKKNIDKFKQTRLQLDVSRERSYDRCGRPVKCDVINDSPKASSSLQHSKATRSWMLRVSNNSKENLERPPEEMFNFPDYTINEHCKKNNEVSEIEFDITNNDITKSDELLADILTAELNEKKAKEESVFALTAETQDIIFLDDTEFDGDVTVDHKKDTTSLKRPCEQNRENLIEKSAVSNLNIKMEKFSQDNTNNLDETFVKELEEFESAKAGNNNIFTKNVKNQLSDAKYTENSEDSMVLPIMVKEEKLSEEVFEKKQSIKERFNIDCQDCLNYIAFLGDNLSDEQIMSHIRQCSRHKESDLLKDNTPDGFWDPFIRSFNENDPRKQVLIDTRFVKKRGGK